MSLTNQIKSGLSTILDSPVIEILVKKSVEQGATSMLDNSITKALTEHASGQVINILREHFNFTPYDIAQIYQKSYSYALAAISSGLATQEQKLTFLQKVTHSALEREFSAKIDENYLQPFATKRKDQNDSLPELRKQLLENIKELIKQPPIFQAEATPFTDTELAAIIHHDGALVITDLVLDQLQSVTTLDATLAAFFRQDELLGNGILFFFRQILHKDAHAEQTLAALQREGLWTDVRDIKTAQENLTATLQQQLSKQKAEVMQAVQAGDFSKANQVTQQLQYLQHSIAEVPQILQTAHTAWQESQGQLLEFSERFDTWACLLDTKVEQVLEEMAQFSWQLENVHADVNNSTVDDQKDT